MHRKDCRCHRNGAEAFSDLGTSIPYNLDPFGRFLDYQHIPRAYKVNSHWQFLRAVGERAKGFLKASKRHCNVHGYTIIQMHASSVHA